MDGIRPNVKPIFNAAYGAMADELDQKWTYGLPEELLLALCRAVVKRLQVAGMLNFNRPWEADDEFADVLAEAGEPSSLSARMSALGALTQQRSPGGMGVQPTEEQRARDEDQKRDEEQEHG